MASYMAKGTLQTKLRILSWEDDPGLLRWAQCNHKGPYKGEEEIKVRGDVTTEKEVGPIRRKGHERRDVGSL